MTIRVRGIAIAAGLFAFASVLLALAALRPAPGEGAGSDAASALPVVGSADPEVVPFGSVTQGAEQGTTWAFRRLTLDTPPSSVDGRRLDFGPAAGGSPAPQLAFMRHRPGGEWEVAAVPLDAVGNPYRGPAPNLRSARMTPAGGAVLVGQDGARPSDRQLVMLARAPGGPFRELPAPPADVLLPAGVPAPGLPAEEPAGDRGAGKVNVAVADDGPRSLTFVVPVGRPVEDAVLVHDGADPGSWSREPIVVSPQASDFTVVAIAARTPDDAWLLARSAGRPVRLFRRTTGADPRWEELPLDGSVLADATAASAAGLEDLAPVAELGQTLTLSGDGVWVDLRFRAGGGSRDGTALVRPARTGADQVETWCDVTTCDHPFGAAFSTTFGYRSFAWSGTGAGTRVISNPLRPGGEGTSNRGTHLELAGNAFVRRPGAGGNFRGGAAFASAGEGWLQGPVEIGSPAPPDRLRQWPVALRSPLTAVSPQPGQAAGGLGAGALAVGGGGAVARHVPGQGWSREFLLSANGGVVRATLRGVAWPEPARAHAVGDLGAMWLWRGDTGLWERDPAAPVGFEANLMAVAFDPSGPQRGFAVGKEGTLLRYDKTWTQDALPAGFAAANFTAVTFAARQAIAVSDRGVIVNDGGGWRVDEGVAALLATLPGANPLLVSASGLQDGGAVIGGYQIVLVRDGPGAAWRFSGQPLLDQTVIASGAFREGDRVRAVVATALGGRYPSPDAPLEIDPNSPTPVLPPYPLPADGYLLRETAEGWRDEQRTAFLGSSEDRPVKSDPVLAMVLDGTGSGWVVGGWSGEADSAGRGASGRSGSARDTRERVQTGAVYRYAPAGAPDGPPGEATAGVPLTPGPVRFVVGGNAQCSAACAELANQRLAPDRMLSGALDLSERLAADRHGPRAFLYTGGRIRPGSGLEGDPVELARFGQLLSSRANLPVYGTVAAGDVGDSGASGASAFRSVFAGAPAPFGTAVAPPGVTPVGPAAGDGAARTHYAFDSAGDGGTVRVIVIDNSRGSLAASDPHQVPAEPQEPWLVATLAEARVKGIPTIVVGSRDLNSSARPALNVAADADRVAAILVEGGASAYLFNRPEENRRAQIPAGAATTIPEFGTGTLGYRSAVRDASSVGLADALFGDGGVLLVEASASARDPATNRVPVNVRLIPVLDGLSLQTLDGTLLRRSRPALFQGLGRRPVAGDRWGQTGGDGSPSPAGADPYTGFPADPCLIAGCSSRITPEYSFSSSAPDVLDFVKTDPASANLRKPLLGADDKVVSDATSGLVCPFNAGNAVVTVAAGGRAFSQTIQVLPGSVLRPCGTRPLDPSRIRRVTPASPSSSPPPPAAAPPADILPALAPPPAPPPPREPVKSRPPTPEPQVPFFAGLLGAAPRLVSTPPVSPPPPPPTFFANPIPPGGATVRVHEEKREEEIAPEQSQANAVAYHPDDHLPVEPFLVGLALIAALAGVTIRPGRRRRPAYAISRTQHDHRDQRLRRRQP